MQRGLRYLPIFLNPSALLLLLLLLLRLLWFGGSLRLSRVCLTILLLHCLLSRTILSRRTGIYWRRSRLRAGR